MEQYITLAQQDRITNRQQSSAMQRGAAVVTLTVECERAIGREQIIPKGE